MHKALVTFMFYIINQVELVFYPHSRVLTNNLLNYKIAAIKNLIWGTSWYAQVLRKVTIKGPNKQSKTALHNIIAMLEENVLPPYVTMFICM